MRFLNGKKKLMTLKRASSCATNICLHSRVALHTLSTTRGQILSVYIKSYFKTYSTNQGIFIL